MSDGSSGVQPVRDATVEVVRDQDGIDALADAWDELYRRCPGATPFQSHAWVAAWARAYRPRRLRVVVVRSGQHLMAVAPLHVVRRGPWPVLTALGRPFADFTDLLLAGDDESGDAAQLLVDALLHLSGWRALDLPEVPVGATASAWARRWPGRVHDLPASMCAELPVAPIPELLQRMPAKAARRIRNHMRRTDAAGIATSVAIAADLPGAVAELLRLHERQWYGRNGNPEHQRPRFAAFLTEALCRMVPAGHALVVRYVLDGELVASEIDLLGPDLLGSYLSGVDPELRKRTDVASLLIRANLGFAADAGVGRFSMLRGEEAYKTQWHPDWVRNRRLVLVRPGWVGSAGFVVGVRARAAAVRLVKARGPRLEETVTRIRQLLRRG